MFQTGRRNRGTRSQKSQSGTGGWREPSQPKTTSQPSLALLYISPPPPFLPQTATGEGVSAVTGRASTNCFTRVGGH